MKKAITLGIVAVATFTVLVMPAAADELFFDPQHSNVSKTDDTVDVEIWVNATAFKSGAINLTYDKTCAKVTNFACDYANFPLCGWTSGSDWITFMTLKLSETGTYRVGTLTIQCVKDCPGVCETPLEFNRTDPGNGEYSALFDEDANEITADWTDGTFSCGVPTKVCLGNCSSAGTLVATDVPCYECIGVQGDSWEPTTRCPDRELYCEPGASFTVCPNCSDGRDNDDDGLIDCPADEGCACCCDASEEDGSGPEPCVPELPTIALTGTGILSLVLWARSRRGRKRE